VPSFVWIDAHRLFCFALAWCNASRWTALCMHWCDGAMSLRRWSACVVAMGVACCFSIFSEITLPICVGHRFHWQVYYYDPPDACIRHTKFQMAQAPLGKSERFQVLCFSHHFFALTCRPYGLTLIFTNLAGQLKANKAVRVPWHFHSARAHMMSWVFHFGVKNPPSEMQWKIVKTSYIGKRCVLEPHGPKIRTDHQMCRWPCIDMLID